MAYRAILKKMCDWNCRLKVSRLGGREGIFFFKLEV